MTVPRGLLRLLLALVVVNSLLMAPHWILEGGLGPRWFALEAFILVGITALLPPRGWSRGLAWVAAVVVVGGALVDLADAVARQSLARPLNLYLDIHLLGAVHNLLRGTLGAVLATGVFVVAGIALAVAIWVVARLLTPADLGGRHRGSGPAALDPRVIRGRLLVRGAGVGLLLFAGVGLLGERTPDALEARTALPVVRVATEQTRGLQRMRKERKRFAAAMAQRPASYAARPRLLDGLGGRDVTLAFVESYGISALRDSLYAPVIRPRLEWMAAELEEAGLTLATGSLRAPSQGGQSWFGHGSVLSGLWLDNQLRYDLLLASGRETLVDDFEHAGYRTAALMPAITLAWPEGGMLGYDEIYDRDHIEYAGPPLNWVTMPDQFTWSFLEHTIRPAAGSQPLFTELGLISSHAPWTPILSVLDDWESIGDGSVFQRWADAGETPRELWRDSDRVREYYGLSLEYAVHTAASYARHYVGDDELLIILGDHQPAPLITGEDASRAVPVHVISGDPDLVEPFLRWGFAPGAFPPQATDEESIPGMDAFRAWFVQAFTPPGPARASTAGAGARSGGR